MLTEGLKKRVGAAFVGHRGRLFEALVKLRRRFGVEILLCEGGPHLSGQLFAAGLVDELFLSVSPAIAGGEAASSGDLRILGRRRRTQYDQRADSVRTWLTGRGIAAARLTAKGFGDSKPIADNTTSKFLK